MNSCLHRLIAVGSALFLGVVSVNTVAAEVEVTSPNGRLQCVVELRNEEELGGVPSYRVSWDGATIVRPSRLGLVLADSQAAGGGALTRDFVMASVKNSEHDVTWQPVYGERSSVRDHYRQAVLTLRHQGPSKIDVELEMRVYDQAVAFCYRVPQQEGWKRLQIERETTEFRFSEDLEAWAVYSAQGVYERTRLGNIKPGCERPLVMRDAAGRYVALGEARLVDHPRMKLRPLAGVDHALESDLSGTASCPLPFRSPWRFIMVADTPGQLLERNDLLLNLNDPCAIADTSWIRPGKVIREVTLTTVGGKACVDFAAAHGLQYVEFDAGWYGHEYDDASDATTVTVDPKRSPGPLDLHEVIRYATAKDVGIILYVNRRALEKQLDEILPLYRQWGVQGVKYGFVNVGSQQWTAWLHDAVRKAAEHQLMVDVHDEYRPTGYSRTYPNLMTQEGIAGDETSPTNELTLTILFTRMLAGAADNTICYYNSRVEENASHAYQLAKAVCIYSPWQFLFWYDRPVGSPGALPGAGNSRGIIGDEPEWEFFAHVSTVWDDTRVIHGAIGEYAMIARRSGNTWFVGAMNNSQQRVLPLPLAFLEPNREYTAHTYRDDPAVKTRTHVRIEQIPVTRDTVLDIELAPRCGQALRIVPR